MISIHVSLLQDNIRREGTPETTMEARPHREQSHNWQLDEALKRTQNAAMMNLLSEGSAEHRSDQGKGQLVDDNRSQAEKPKAADTKKRGRPRKSTKSPKRGHRTSDENLKNGTSRSKTRAVGAPVKKKQPISKALLTTTTSEDDSDDSRSHGVSSDSISDHRTNNVPAVVPPVAGQSRLSLSSSDDESPSNKKKNSASEDESARWRRVSIKRNKLSDSSKKQDKRKSPTKAKPRRPRSRMTNVTGGSDSESESEVSVRSSRIQVAR